MENVGQVHEAALFSRVANGKNKYMFFFYYHPLSSAHSFHWVNSVWMWSVVGLLDGSKIRALHLLEDVAGSLVFIKMNHLLFSIKSSLF